MQSTLEAKSGSASIHLSVRYSNQLTISPLPDWRTNKRWAATSLTHAADGFRWSEAD